VAALYQDTGSWDGRGAPREFDSGVHEAYETLKDRPGMSQVPRRLIVHTINQIVVVLMANI